MKKLILIAFTFMISLSFGQEWRDSLTSARNSYKAKNYEKAFQSYKSAQELAPEGIDLSEEMGQSAYKSHKYKYAENIYSQKGSSENDKSKKAADYHNLGNTRMRTKDYQGAVDAYKEALRNNPSDSETRYNLSEAIRQFKNQTQQKKKDKQENDNQDKKDNQDNKTPQQNEGQDKKNSNGKPQNPSEQKDGNSQNQSEGPKLKDKAVEKKLDDLMKQEANTKRKLSGRSSDGGSSKSGKDW